MRKIIFQQRQAPGDLLMLSIAIRDLHINYPNLYETDVLCYYPEVFFNNKYITHLPKDKNIKIIDLDYGPYLKKLREKKYHFSDCFIYMLNEKLNLNIKKTKLISYINLTNEEKDRDYFFKKFGIKNSYIVINAGIKNDIPLKQYPLDSYQKIVKILSSQLKSLYNMDIIQSGHSHHIHYPLNGAINFIGKTDNLRDFFSLIYHSEMVIGPVSLQMHLAAAFNKPSITIAGGREEPSWETYDEDYYLNSIGMFDCCKIFGCWFTQRNECKNMGQYYPKCMEVIFYEIIISLVFDIINLKRRNK